MRDDQRNRKDFELRREWVVEPGGSEERFRRGFLKDDLDAAEDPLGPPTTATVLQYSRDRAGLLQFKREFKVSSYDTTLTLEAGTYVKCEKIQGKWEIYWAACSAPDSSSSSSSTSSGE